VRRRFAETSDVAPGELLATEESGSVRLAAAAAPAGGGFDTFPLFANRLRSEHSVVM
jgi:hypothetical protein